MKDLSKEERLEQQILEMAEKCGDKKWLRVKRTYLILSGSLYLIAIFYGLRLGISDIAEGLYLLLCALLGALFTAGVIMFISGAVLYYIVNGAMKDEKAIAKKIGELEAIKFSKYE